MDNENKIGSFDNDYSNSNNSNSMDDFNNLVAPGEEDLRRDEESMSTSYTKSSNSSSFTSFSDDSDNGKSTFKLDKKFIIIPVVVILLLIILIIVIVSGSNKYEVKDKVINIKVKEETQINVTAKDKVKAKLTYVSDDEKIASVSKDGLVKGVTMGKTFVWVGINGKKTKKITVNVDTNKEPLVLKEENITIAKDEKKVLEVKNVLDDDVFEYKSNNLDVVEIDAEGNMTGIHAGTATVTVIESDGRSISTRVTVTSDETLIQSMSHPDITVAIGETYKLKPTVNPSKALKILYYKSSKESIFTVDEKGNVKGVGAGTATLTITSHNGKRTTAKVTVDPKKAASIKISGCPGNISMNSPVQLKAVLSPSTATSRVTWTSSNPSIAVVSSGKVTGKGTGKVTITAEAEGRKATCKLTVSPMAVTSIKISTTTLTLDQDVEKQLTVSYTPSAAKQYHTATWYSSNTKVVKVDQTGKITTVGPGTATVTASAGGKSASVSIKVNATAVTKVEMSGCPSQLDAGKSTTLKATVQPSTAKVKTVTWSSSDSTIATVSSSGVVTGKLAGNVKITATSKNGKTAVCNITVKAPDLGNLSFYVSSSKVTSTTLTAETEKTISIKSDKLSETELRKYYKISWTTVNTNIISLTETSYSNQIKVKAIAAPALTNPTTIYCNIGGTEAKTISVVVSPPELKSVSYSSSSITINKGSSKTITASVGGVSASKFTKYYKATWSSSNTGVATVTNTNSLTTTIKGVKAGTSTITFKETKTGKNFKITVTVK